MTRMTLMIALLAIVSTLGAGCGSSGPQSLAAEVVDVASVDPIRDAFDRDSGRHDCSCCSRRPEAPVATAPVGLQTNVLDRFPDADLRGYDVYFLYPPTARWEARPEPVVSTGAPVVAAGPKLDAALEEFFTGS